MVLEKLVVHGFEDLVKAAEGNQARTIVLLTGSKESDGKSWCPDCVKAEPVIEEVLKELAESEFAKENDICFIECFVGERNYWKSRENPFRIDDRIKISSIPTVMEYGNRAIQLTEDQCACKELLMEFITGDY